MKNKLEIYIKKILLVSMLLLLPFSCFSISFGPKISTLGYGIESTLYDFGPFSLRANLNHFRKSINFNEKAINYDITPNLTTLGLYGDFRPFGGGLFLSGGLVLNNNKFKGTARPSRNVTIRGRTYTPLEIGSIDSKVKYHPISPYLGLGYSLIQKPVTFNIELGVLFQHGARASVSTTGVMANNPQLISDLEYDLENVANSSISKYYPVIGLSLLF